MVSSRPGGLILADFLQVLPTAANAMHFFRRVDHLKIGGKRTDNLHRQRQIQTPDQSGQLFAWNLIAFATANRSEPCVLDHVEELLAPLILQELADQRAKRAHVIPQGLVFILESDVLPA